MPDVRQPGIRDVLLVAAVAVAVVLLAAGDHRGAAARGPGGRLPHAAPDRGPRRRHGVRAVAHPARAQGLTDSSVASDVPVASSGRAAARPARGRSPRGSPTSAGTCSSSAAASSASGALLDAASRGLRVALVEQDDIASGTSSRSSRLIHGGLRYLQQLHVGLVREALDERARLLRLAPHLVRLEEFLFPLYGLPIVTRAFYGTGMTMYDVLGSAKSGGRHRQLSTASTLEYAPNLRRKGLRGGARLPRRDGGRRAATRSRSRGRPSARGRGGASP